MWNDLTPTLARINTLSPVDAALTYAAAFPRLKLFPIDPESKVPLKKWGSEATSDPGDIREWWQFETPEANIGGVCGDYLLVIDLDYGKNPKTAETVRMMKDMGYDFPDTATQITTNEGVHLFYLQGPGRWRNKAGQLRIAGHGIVNSPGVDIRASGGMVLLAPSKIGDGQYQWLTGGDKEMSFAQAPWWLDPEPEPQPFKSRPIGSTITDRDGYSYAGQKGMEYIDTDLGKLTPGVANGRSDASIRALTFVMRMILEGNVPRRAADDVFDTVQQLFPESGGSQEAQKIWASASQRMGM